MQAEQQQRQMEAPRNPAYVDQQRNRTYTPAPVVRDAQRPQGWDGQRWNGQNWDRNRDGRADRDWNRNGTWNRDRNWNQNRSGNWSRNWRQDNRYDWRDWRNAHRETYRLGRYAPPYRSYAYRRLGIGFYLDSMFFGPNYWIEDPWMYRLPPAYGPYRWVRYYDDALLVDTYNGEVVDVIYDFFW